MKIWMILLLFSCLLIAENNQTNEAGTNTMKSLQSDLKNIKQENNNLKNDLKEFKKEIMSIKDNIKNCSNKSMYYDYREKTLNDLNKRLDEDEKRLKNSQDDLSSTITIIYAIAVALIPVVAGFIYWLCGVIGKHIIKIEKNSEKILASHKTTMEESSVRFDKSLEFHEKEAGRKIQASINQADDARKEVTTFAVEVEATIGKIVDDAGKIKETIKEEVLDELQEKSSTIIPTDKKKTSPFKKGK